MGKTTDRFNGLKLYPLKNLVMRPKFIPHIIDKVNDRDALMLISGFKLYNKLR